MRYNYAMKKAQTDTRRPIGPIGLLKEFNQSLGLIHHYLDQIINERQLLLGTPLSVELRRLYLPGRGNHLLETIQRQFQVEIKYTVTDSPPDKYKLIGLDEYINGLAFVSNNKAYSRKEVIELVANQRGAHTDEEIDPLHFESAFVDLPWGNPAQTKLFVPQDLHIMMQVGRQTLIVADKQLRVLSIK